MRAAPCLRVELAVLRRSIPSTILRMRQRLEMLGRPTSIHPNLKADHARPLNVESEVSWFLWEFLEADHPSNLAANLRLAHRDTYSTSESRHLPVRPGKWPLFRVLSVPAVAHSEPRRGQKAPANSSPAVTTPTRNRPPNDSL